jgi:hypothetical protein
VLKETRQNRGTTEKWYETVPRSFGPIPAARGAARRTASAARRAVASTVLELSRQELLLAMQQRRKARPIVARIVVAAQPKRMAVLRKRVLDVIEEIHREFGVAEDHVSAAGDERWAVTLSFAPASGPGEAR